MPSLDDILKDTLVKIGGLQNPVGLTEFELGTNNLAQRPVPDPKKYPYAQPVWFWDYTGMREIKPDTPMNRMENLEIWSRTIAGMHSVDQGWMTVAMSTEWDPITITLPLEKLTLPLTQKYFVKGYKLLSGSNAGSNDWWPLPADMDQSFACVFLHDLTSRQQTKPPVTVSAERYNKPDFMPDPNVDVGFMPVGGTVGNGDTEDRHIICVVMSLACMQERADYDQNSVVGMARFYPHFMIMSNKRIPAKVTIARQDFTLGMDATIRVTRPDRSGYHNISRTGGVPQIMQHPDMDPVILPLLITEPNEKRGLDPFNKVVAPYWDLIFDYHQAFDYRSGAKNLIPRTTSARPEEMTRVVDRRLVGPRRLKGVLKHLDYNNWWQLLSVLVDPASADGLAILRPSLRSVMFNKKKIGKVLKSSFLPRIAKDIFKLPGQGTFDNLHLAPRMRAHTAIGTPEMSAPEWQSSLNTLDTVLLAPFCEHDCMHTHWRWGLAFEGGTSTNEKPLCGFVASPEPRFAGTGAPFKKIGEPMVPLNQDIDIGFGSNSQLVYSARISEIAPGVWQPV